MKSRGEYVENLKRAIAEERAAIKQGDNHGSPEGLLRFEAGPIYASLWQSSGILRKRCASNETITVLKIASTARGKVSPKVQAKFDGG